MKLTGVEGDEDRLVLDHVGAGGPALRDVVVGLDEAALVWCFVSVTVIAHSCFSAATYHGRRCRWGP